MRVSRSPRQIRKELKAIRVLGKRIAFVPTMGALHEGHLGLVRRARREGDLVVVSIFVNPAQFGPKEDFRRYPRNPAADRALLKRERVDLLFNPNVSDIYPAGFDTYVLPGKIADRLEGAFRPTHFRGVATVVLKLLNIVQPDVALFGRKDLQQSLVIEKMVSDLGLPVRIVVAPTVRDRDGLALSSRNAYLTKLGRKKALVISASLLAARQMIRDGERSATRIRNYIERRLLREAEAEVDYVSVAERSTLCELQKISGQVAISVACRIERVRLIDNLTLKV